MNLINLTLLLILNLSSVFTEFTEEFYDHWLEKYRQVSGNVKPPNRYKEWINLATRMNVSIEPSVYRKIFEHLSQFKKEGLTVEKLKDQLRRVKAMHPDSDIVGFDRHGLQTHVSLKRFPYGDNFMLLSEVLDPSIEVYVIIQKKDEGMVIPADDDQTIRYEDMCDVFRRNKAMRNEWGNYADKCIHLQAPSTFQIIPFEAAIFGINRLRGGSKDILYATDQTGILYYERFLHHALRAPSWENKRAVANFRGSATGISYVKVIADKIPITNNPRYKLHEMTLLQRQGKLQCSVALDFGVINFNHCNNRQFMQSVKSQFTEARSMNYDDQFKAKYQVVVDGHGWPDRIAFFMASGSLVFLASLHEDWTINQIIDGEHYIKVKPDLSDLVEKLEWAAKNDVEAKRIAENGKKFALSNLRRPQAKIYNAMLFMEFQGLFDKKIYPQNA